MPDACILQSQAISFMLTCGQIFFLFKVARSLGTNLALTKPSSLGTNLALNKPSEQSYNYTSSKYSANKGNYGKTDIKMDHNECMHTAMQAGWHWWMVDLQNNYEVFNIRIYNRGDCCTERLKNFQVEISKWNPKSLPRFPKLTGNGLCLNHPGPLPGGPTLLICITPVVGRYVTLLKESAFDDPLSVKLKSLGNQHQNE